MSDLRLTNVQLNRANKVEKGETLTLNPYWNSTSGLSLKLPDNPICQGIEKCRGSQTNIRFLVGEGVWLDAAWFVFPDSPLV